MAMVEVAGGCRHLGEEEGEGLVEWQRGEEGKRSVMERRRRR